MCVGMTAKVVGVKNGMAVIDASGARREISAELIDNLEPGTATVKITGKGNYTGVKSLTFTIKKTGEDPVSGNKLIIDKESATLEVGETLQLNVTIESDEILAVVPEWTSSKSSVAKVSEEGLVTALSEGNTVITATFEELTAECKVTVTEGTVVVEPDHIVVTPPAKTEYEQGEELKLDGGKVTVYYTDESTEVVSFFLSKSIFMRVRPVPSHRPFRNSRL